MARFSLDTWLWVRPISLYLTDSEFSLFCSRTQVKSRFPIDSSLRLHDPTQPLLRLLDSHLPFHLNSGFVTSHGNILLTIGRPSVSSTNCGRANQETWTKVSAYLKRLIQVLRAHRRAGFPSACLSSRWRYAIVSSTGSRLSMFRAISS